ncbi:uncharacterized protein [Henckelia pumila]|uniref:uncharacterized protein n=1 Tax=Henckelia pumila TaxID=405737 RepID=UPI003C6E6CE7
MLDAISAGVFVDKTPVQARNLIENMAANSQQFGTNRSDPAPRRNNEVNFSSLKQQMIDLMSLVRQMAVGNGQNMKVCGICTARGHATDMCPTLQDGSTEQVNAAGGFPGPPQWNYDPYSDTYNSGWRDHPNLRYGNLPVNQPAPHVQPSNQAYGPPYPPQPQRPQVPMPGEFLENIVKDLATNTVTFQEETRASIQQLNTQMGQLATAVNRLEALNSNSLPSQTVVNLRENVSAITLRSGKELKESNVEEDETVQMDAPKGKFPPFFEDKPVAPFPLALKEFRKDEGIKGLYEVFRRCENGTHKMQGPRGVIEDVLVQVGKLVFPTDFYVLDIKNNDLNGPTLLGRPFLKTSKSIIDVDNGTLTMEFDEEIAKFNIFDTLKNPSCELL